LHMAQLMPLPLSLASVKSRLVLPFWYRLTRVVPKRAVKRVCVYVCVCVVSIETGFLDSVYCGSYYTTLATASFMACFVSIWLSES